MRSIQFVFIFIYFLFSSSQMFLQFSSLHKHPLSQQKTTNNQNINNGPNLDDFAFTDFFIRKHPNKRQFPPSNPLQYQIQTNTIQKPYNQSISQNPIEPITYQKGQRINTFCLHNQKLFQIKFLQNKNQKPDSSQSPFKQGNSLKQGNSSKNKQKRQELIQSRKNKQSQIYTPRPSTKYSNQMSRYSNVNIYHSNEIARSSNKLSKDQENKCCYKRQRKSMEICKNLGQPANNLQFCQMSLANAYKVKSLVLGKNPKEQHLQKSKKVRGPIDDKRQSRKKINSMRTKSERPSWKKIQTSFGETTRISTQYKSPNLNKNQLSSRTQQNHRKSVKLNSIYRQVQGQLHKQDITLEPWNKELSFEPWSKGIEIDNFDGKVGQSRLNMKQMDLSPLEYNDMELVRLQSRTGQRKNCFRRIYSTKQNSKLKSTILSEK